MAPLLQKHRLKPRHWNSIAPLLQNLSISKEWEANSLSIYRFQEQLRHRTLEISYSYAQSNNSDILLSFPFPNQQWSATNRSYKNTIEGNLFYKYRKNPFLILYSLPQLQGYASTWSIYFWRKRRRGRWPILGSNITGRWEFKKVLLLEYDYSFNSIVTNSHVL